MQFAVQYHRERGRSHKRWFLSHREGYHGNTLGGLSLSGHARRTVVPDLAHPFPSLPTPYRYRDGQGLSDAEYADRLLSGAREQLQQHAEHLAGVVVEPVGGATLGATVPPDGYLQGLRALCDEFDALLIVDEVMTGLGRTGAVLAVDHWGVRPDLVALGKGLGAGYTPVAAVTVDRAILETIADGTGRILGGHTYGGNPLSMATALAVLDVFDAERLVARAESNGEILRRGLEDLAARHDAIGEARGLGMLHALELKPAGTRREHEPAGVMAQTAVQAIMRRGVSLYATTGGFNDALLVAPPLTIDRDEIDFLVNALHAAFGETL